jgi:hypothetical protein
MELMMPMFVQQLSGLLRNISYAFVTHALTLRIMIIMVVLNEFKRLVKPVLTCKLTIT